MITIKKTDRTADRDGDHVYEITSTEGSVRTTYNVPMAEGCAAMLQQEIQSMHNKIAASEVHNRDLQLEITHVKAKGRQLLEEHEQLKKRNTELEQGIADLQGHLSHDEALNQLGASQFVDDRRNLYATGTGKADKIAEHLKQHPLTPDEACENTSWDTTRGQDEAEKLANYPHTFGEAYDKLRPHQKEAIEQFKETDGIVELPAGIGKTQPNSEAQEQKSTHADYTDEELATAGKMGIPVWKLRQQRADLPWR